MRYIADTVVFLVYPATLVAIKDNMTTNAVADACVK